MKHIPSINKPGPQPQKLAALRQAHRDWNESPDVLTRLTRRLSTTLSLETQLAILADEIASVVPHDCLTYRHTIASRDFVYVTGMAAPIAVNIGSISRAAFTAHFLSAVGRSSLNRNSKALN
ncbi:hypothetical protein [Marinobacter sp.]|uniref:hypothetical protein n=1 Tax=Marinobacter sp. TaxID=50741 RepID=UPI003BACCD02